MVNAPWSYEPSGDCDGERIGTDHFVLDVDGNEVACPGDEATARLISAAPCLLSALKAFLRMDAKNEEISGGEWHAAVVTARAAVAQAEGRGP